VFSLVALPLFVYLRGPHGQRQIEWLAEYCAHPGAIFTLAVPLALVDAFAHTIWTGVGAVAETLVYLACFVYGYALYADPRFGQAIRRQWVPALVIGMGLWLIAEIFLVAHPPHPYENAMGSLLFLPLRGIIAWFWVIGLVGFGMTYLSRTSRLLRYLADAAYPVYVLHVAAIVSVGYALLGWQAPMLVKFVVIMVAAFIITFGLYEVLIKRVRVLRLLFGLRGAPASEAPPPESPAPLTTTSAPA
jgi:peptidoglycan/LPS O-acetylase OafA/YrhL